MPIINPRFQQSAPPPRRIVPQEERLGYVLPRLSAIRAELHSATYPTIVRDRLKETLDMLEFLLTGVVTESHPNMVPGTPASVLDDPTKTRVEFVTHAPQGVINSGDAVFTPGPVAGSVGHPQDVEFFQGPPSGQRVEFFQEPQSRQTVTSPASGMQAHHAPTHSIEAGSQIPGATPQVAHHMPIPLLQE